MGVITTLARLYGLVRLSLQRLLNQFGLAACLALGIAVAVMLASAIPMFSDAVQSHVLQDRLADGVLSAHAKVRLFCADEATQYAKSNTQPASRRSARCGACAMMV